MSNQSQENTPLGNLLGAAGFFSGLYLGWKFSEGNGWATVITGIVLGAIGAAVGNLAFRLLVVAASILVSFFMWNVQRAVVKGVWNGITESSQPAVVTESMPTNSVPTYTPPPPPVPLWVDAVTEPPATPVPTPPVTRPSVLEEFFKRQDDPKTYDWFGALSPPAWQAGMEAAKTWSSRNGYKLLPPVKNDTKYDLSLWIYYQGVGDQWVVEGPYAIGAGTETPVLANNTSYITSKSPHWYFYAEAKASPQNWTWGANDVTVTHNGKSMNMRIWKDAERQFPWRFYIE